MPMKPVSTAIVVSVGPLIDDTDFTSLETAIAYDAAGMSVFRFIETTAGIAVAPITPTSGGANDWTHKVNGVYELEITAAQNTTRGVLWVVGICDGVLVFESPRYQVVSANVYDSLATGSDKLQVDAVEISSDSTAADNLESACDNYSVTRGLAGTALPDAVADAAGGVPISDAGELDLDTKLANTNEITVARMGALTDWINGGRLDLLLDKVLDTIAGVAGGLAVRTTMASVRAIQGSEQDLGNASTSDDSRWTGDDDGSGAEFIFRCTPANTDAVPGDLHVEGYYDEPVGATNGATLSVYNFNTASWDVVQAYVNGAADVVHDLVLTQSHGAPGGGTIETVDYTIGDVLIKFEQDTQETGNACLLIDAMHVGFIESALAAIAEIRALLPNALVAGRIDASIDGTGMESGAVDAILTKQMTESYHTDGAPPTLAQALCFLIASLTEFAISGTTITAKKLDGAATAATFTLDDANDPTSRTRAS